MNSFYVAIFSFIFLMACKQESQLVDEQEKVAYIFSYFKGNGEDGLHLAYSLDGYHWEALNQDKSILTPQVGQDKLMRDPCIIRGRDGKYHMVWTQSWSERGIGYAWSEDLVNWSEQKEIPVMAHEPKARNCWAPEITYDPVSEQYMIYWATTIPGLFPETQSAKDDARNHRMYYTLTKDFDHFTETKLLLEPGFNVIDATIKYIDGRYFMILKDETPDPPQKNLKTAEAQDITGPYTDISEPITGDYWAEGPTFERIDSNYIVYFDKYTEHRFGAMKSKDLMNWDDISDQMHFPDGIRHGTILPINLTQLNHIKELLKSKSNQVIQN